MPNSISRAASERRQIWMLNVNSMLKKGFGVEDIALRLKSKPSSIRKHICILRENGMLNAWFR